MSSLEEFAAAILEDGEIDATELAQIRERLYSDGTIDQEEADFLFLLNDKVASGEAKIAEGANWGKLFVSTVTNFVLSDDTSPGTVDAEEASYLIEKIGSDGQIDGNELALLVNIAAKATGESPDNFNQYTLDAVQAAVIADGIVDAEEVDMMKKVVYGAGGAGGSDVDRAEADMIFAINDATTDNSGHDASWQAFFVEALSKHVLEDDDSPGTIDADEANYLIEQIGSDGQIDGNELALLVNIAANATGESPENFNQYTLNALQAAVIADGIVDAEEVELMQKVIYGAGGAGGSDVDRAEAEMLFAINDATTDNSGHDASWQAFFVEAIGKHVLEDEESPGAIDADEGNWLAEKIDSDGQVDDNEKALLAHIKANATSIEGNLTDVIERLG